MPSSKESWLTPKGILKILLFPVLIMVNPKIYFPYAEEEEPPRGGEKGTGEGDGPTDPSS
jgi:hypothetical protein